MLKRWFIAFLLVVFLMPGNVQAHSTLGSSQPKEGEVKTESVKEVSLTFSTKIENGSRFSITNESGDTIEVTNMTTEGDMLSGVLASPLNDGQYTVDWMIIGADGHPIEGNYMFAVKSKSQEDLSTNDKSDTKEDVSTKNETEIDHDDDQTEISDSEENTEQKQITSKQAHENRQTGATFILGIIFVIAIACFVAVFWVMKKSEK